MPSSALKHVSFDLDHWERLNSALVYTPLTGKLWWIKGTYADHPAGCLGNIYFEHVKYKVVNVIWYLMEKEWPKHRIVHLNDDKLDFRWSNLSKGYARERKEL